MALCRLTFHLARNIFSSHSSAEEALSYHSVTSFLMDIYFISALFQTYPSSIHTSIAKDSLQTDQANPVLSVLFFKYHSVTFGGTLEKMGPKIWARRPERAPPKVQRHRSLLTAPLFKPYLHKGLLRTYYSIRLICLATKNYISTPHLLT